MELSAAVCGASGESSALVRNRLSRPSLGQKGRTQRGVLARVGPAMGANGCPRGEPNRTRRVIVTPTGTALVQLALQIDGPLGDSSRDTATTCSRLPVKRVNDQIFLKKFLIFKQLK